MAMVVQQRLLLCTLQMESLQTHQVSCHLFIYLFVFVLLRRDIGNVYISDYDNHRVRKVTYGTTAGPSAAPTYTPTKSPSYQPTYAPSYVTTAIPTVASVITTVAGTGTASYSGDSGAATSATLDNPAGVAVDSSGEHVPCSVL